MEQYNELYHYGVKGMKWGVRRDKKWASSPTQPSSYRSSSLAGTYAATGNKRIAKKLDKSNAKDAERWKKAREKYPEEAKLGDKRLSEMSKIDKKLITINQKYDRELSKEATKMRKQYEKEGSADESKLETLLTERYNYNKIADHIADRISKMSYDELNNLDSRKVDDDLRRYLDKLDKAAK